MNRNRLSLLAASLCLVLVGCRAARKATTDVYATRHYDRASEAAAHGKTERAIHEAELVLKVAPNHREANLLLAGLYAEKHQWKKALACLRKVEQAKMDPEEGLQFKFTLADTYDKLNMVDKAEREYTAALEQARTRVRTTRQQLRAIRPRQRRNRQLEIQLAKRQREVAVASNNLGYFYAVRGKKLKEAEQLVRDALHCMPEAGFILDSLGWVYYRQHQYEKAVHELQLAKGYSSEDDRAAFAETVYHLGMAYLAIDKELEAQEEFEEVLHVVRDHQDTLNALRLMGINPEELMAEEEEE